MQIQSTNMSDTRTKFPLSKKKIVKRTIARIWRWLITLALFLPIIFSFSFAVRKDSLSTDEIFASFNGNIIAGLVFTVLLLVAIIGYFYEKWYFEVYFYNLADDFIIIKKKSYYAKRNNLTL